MRDVFRESFGQDIDRDQGYVDRENYFIADQSIHPDDVYIAISVVERIPNWIKSIFTPLFRTREQGKNRHDIFRVYMNGVVFLYSKHDDYLLNWYTSLSRYWCDIEAN